MKLPDKIANELVSASSKALATTGDAGLNVVPVSSVKVDNGQIWLIDYFFGKTRKNVLSETRVSLVFWTDLKGYQIKANSQYLTTGSEFEAAQAWIKKLHPERKVLGLLKLTPQEIHDISIDTLV